MAILENQRVAKRSGTVKSRRKNSRSRSASSNSDFMGLFNQHPVSPKKRKKSSTGKKQKVKPENKNTLGSKIHTIAALAVIVFTGIIAYAVLYWDNSNIKTPELYVFKLPNNETAADQIIDYAALGTSSFLPSEQETQTELAANTGAPPANDKEDSNRGLLVTFEWREYKMQKGDVISKIAEQFGVSIGAIIASNEISNVRRIPEGKVLRIPNIDGVPYKVARGDNLSKIAFNFKVPLEVILDVNDLKSDVIKPGETLFIPGGRMNEIDLRLSLGDLFLFPLQTRKFITSYYGMRKDPKTGVLQFHAGVDFSANTGTAVLASMDGEIAVVDENWLYGKFIIMTHPNGYKTLYGHLNSYSVKAGDKVIRGKKIAESGNTGYSTGPHLHFGIYDRNNRLVNPLDLIN
ncbi:MAG: M23 family metallopeptidase [Treponema sp.]|nr:M23 family metallopeptidase [Treponema sp.]MCL2251770.1 M23 family metallopeptidase [Treponema sp.]